MVTIPTRTGRAGLAGLAGTPGSWAGTGKPGGYAGTGKPSGWAGRRSGCHSSRGQPSVTYPAGPVEGEVNAVRLVACVLDTQRAA